MSFFREANADLHDAQWAREQSRMASTRARLEARAVRMLDPRAQSGGTDLESLAVLSRAREVAAADRVAAAAADAEAMKDALRVAAEMEQAAAAARRESARAAADANAALIAAAPGRTTADLNDPFALRTARPVREVLDDARLGPASAQVFAGEDPTARMRTAVAQAQTRAWTQQMIDEKGARKAAERAAAMQSAREAEQFAAMAEEMNKDGERSVRERRMRAARENIDAIEARAVLKAEEKRADAAASAEGFRALTAKGGILAESVDDGLSATNPNRYRCVSQVAPVDFRRPRRANVTLLRPAYD